MRLIINTMQVSEKIRYVHALEHEHPLELFYYDSLTTRSRGGGGGHGGEGEGEGEGGGGGGGVSSIVGLPANVWSEIIVRENAPLNQTYVIRLQNVVAAKSNVVEIASLSSVLAPWKIVGCVETTLTTTQSRVDNNHVRLVWNAEGEDDDVKEVETKRHQNKNGRGGDNGCDSVVLLNSLDIKTFVFGVIAANI